MPKLVVCSCVHCDAPRQVPRVNGRDSPLARCRRICPNPSQDIFPSSLANDYSESLNHVAIGDDITLCIPLVF